MSETEKLRALLDAAGVEHADMGGMTEFIGANGEFCRCYTRPDPCRLDVSLFRLTAEQAVDATLGRGETHKVKAVGYSPDGGEYEYLACSECGEWIDADLGCIGESDGPRFCRSCGREFDGPLRCKRCGQLANLECDGLCMACDMKEVG